VDIAHRACWLWMARKNRHGAGIYRSDVGDRIAEDAQFRPEQCPIRYAPAPVGPEARPEMLVERAFEDARANAVSSVEQRVCRTPTSNCWRRATSLRY